MNTSIIQNITFPLHQALYKRETRKYLLELNETQWYSKEQIKEYQLNKLKKLTEHSFKYSKYYNYLFLVNNINPEELNNFNDFSKIPLLSKEEAIASYDDIICEDVDRRKLIWGTTSGSTGVPFRYAQDRKACDFRDAIELRSRSWWGIKYGDPVFVIWGSRGSFSTISKDRIKYKIENIKAKLYNRYKFSAYDLSPSNMNKWIQEFFRIKPKSIYSYVSSAYFFAQHILNYNVDLSGLGLKIVICTSEPLFKKQRSIISKAFNCQVVNEYGVSESGICAFECSHGSFHIMSENIYLEIIRNGKNIKDGEIGEIVITQLNNFAAPLIRYHTGDLGRIRNKN
ncbi:MAG: phenylacetate--CoA ligase family protein [Bacteroidetes bacterium]|nr:phenylacetate--CoA ligase family protein [Bacteroidota bacterium]